MADVVCLGILVADIFGNPLCFVSEDVLPTPRLIWGVWAAARVYSAKSAMIFSGSLFCKI